MKKPMASDMAVRISTPSMSVTAMGKSSEPKRADAVMCPAMLSIGQDASFIVLAKVDIEWPCSR